MESDAYQVLSIADYDRYTQMKRSYRKKHINKLCARVIKVDRPTYRQKVIDNYEEEVTFLHKQLKGLYDMINDLKNNEGEVFKKRTLKNIHNIIHNDEEYSSDSDSE
jgi:hypothetical protein